MQNQGPMWRRACFVERYATPFIGPFLFQYSNPPRKRGILWLIEEAFQHCWYIFKWLDITIDHRGPLINVWILPLHLFLVYVLSALEIASYIFNPPIVISYSYESLHVYQVHFSAQRAWRYERSFGIHKGCSHVDVEHSSGKVLPIKKIHGHWCFNNCWIEHISRDVRYRNGVSLCIHHSISCASSF